MQGHGQRELLYALFGINRTKSDIELWGRRVVLRNPRKALTSRAGMALVPEDRANQGLLLSKSVRENLTLSSICRFTRFGLTNATQEAALVRKISESLNIKAAPDQAAASLSGGNLTQARVLLLYDPTRGIDIGAKAEIFQLIHDLTQRGYAILFYSSDLSELIHVADRVAIFRRGRIVCVLDSRAVAESDILRAMLGKENTAR